MNLFQLTFNRYYLHSPKTWLHNIKSTKKVFFVFLNLLYLPYLNLTYMVNSTYLFIIIIITLKIPKKNMIDFLKIFIPTILFAIILIVTNQDKIYKNLFTIIKVLGPVKKFYLNANSLTSRCSYNIVEWKFYILKVPVFITRIILISVTYICCMQILFLTTTYEHIILLFLSLIYKIIKNQQKTLVLILALSIQFIESNIKQLNKLTIGIKLRGFTYQNIIQFYNLEIIFSYLLNLFSLSIINDIKRISSILYNRDIKIINLQDFNILN